MSGGRGPLNSSDTIGEWKDPHPQGCGPFVFDGPAPSVPGLCPRHGGGGLPGSHSSPPGQSPRGVIRPS